MAQGFRGMKDDFMELINYVMAISCFPFANGDDHSLHPPLLAAGDSDGLGVSEVPLPVDSAGRDAATLAIVPGSALASTATVNEGTVNSFPQGPKVEKEELVESLNNSCYPTSVNNANSCTASQIAGTKCTTNQNLETRGSAESPSFILANVLEGRPLDSSNAENEGGCYTNMEEEDVSIVKHFSNQCSLVEDHMPLASSTERQQLRKRVYNSLKEEQTTGFHEIDDLESGQKKVRLLYVSGALQWSRASQPHPHLATVRAPTMVAWQMNKP